MTFLMQEDLPYAEDTFSVAAKEFMFEHRQLEFEPSPYDELIEIMADVNSE